MNESQNESKRALVANHCPNLAFDEAAVIRLVDTLDRQGGFDAPAGELSIAFVSKDEISTLHEQFMDDPAPTDVITFPGEPEAELAGEICVCPDVAHEYALSNQSDFDQELTLYVVHGYLHLCGFDDIEEPDRADMRRAERVAMDLLQRAQAIPTFRFQPSA